MVKKTPKKVEAKSAKSTISKEEGGVSEITEEQVGDIRLFEEPPCNVGYSAGVTLPRPDDKYSNVKYTIMLNIPCAHDEINETFNFAEDWVDNNLNTIIEEFYEQFEDDDDEIPF